MYEYGLSWYSDLILKKDIPNIYGMSIKNIQNLNFPQIFISVKLN